jgi:hypothetical protein
LFAVRIADRASKGVRTSPRDALIADSTPAEMRGRAFGFHRGMDHLGAAIGPLLAAAFLWFWRDAPAEAFETAVRHLFLLTAVPGALVVVLLWLGLRGLADAQWHVWAFFVAYAVFYAMTEPAEKTLVANLVEQEDRGLAYGWCNCAIGIATLPASVVFGVVCKVFGPLAAFGSGAGLSLVATILLAFLPRRGN